MPDGDDNKPANLPRGAPDALKRFVKCEVDSGSLDLTDTAWLNELPMVAGAAITVKPGATSSRATITLDAEWTPAFDLDVSIVDGQLVATVPGTVGEALNGPIKEWTDKVNATLRRNGKQMRDFQVDGTTITMRKQVIPPAAAVPAAAATAPVTSVAVGESEPETEPAEKKKGWGCAAWIAGVIAAIAVAVGFVVATGGDDGDDSITSGTGEPAATTTSSSTTEPPPAPSTTQQVGQAPPPPEPETRVCGTFPEGDFHVDSFFDVFTEIAVDAGPGCVPGPGSYTNDNCDPFFLPCSDGGGLQFTLTGDPVGTDHTRSVPDADTGQEGNSTALFAFLMAVYGDEAVVARIISDCGGNIVTGEVAVTNGEVNVLEQPLLTFGPCVVADADVLIQTEDGDDILRPIPEFIGMPYTVTDAQPPPGLPPVDFFVASNPAITVRDDWAAAPLTLNGTLGGAAFDDGCTWFFSPDADQFELLAKVLDGCSTNQDRFWVFAAATTNVEIEIRDPDLLVGHGAAEILPFDDTSAFNNVMFDNTVFPCGFGDVALTVCPDGGGQVDGDAYVSVSAATNGAIPLEGDGTERLHEVDFGPAGGPTYVVSQEADGWTIESTGDGTRARALLRDNSLTFVVPRDELPDGSLSYVWRSTIDGQTLEQPVAAVAGLITLPPSPSTAPPATDPPPTDPPVTDPPATETLDEFYSQLSASVSSGDLGFSLDRLHPTVLEAYPTQCPAAIESFADPELVIAFVSEGATGPWTWELPDGRSFDIPDAIEVTITLSGRGQSGVESEAHVAIVDNQYRWFTICE